MVYQDYIVMFDSLRDAAQKFILSATPSAPLTFCAITKYWGLGHPALNIAKPGSDFCDLCTKVRYDLHNLNKLNECYDMLNHLLTKHRKKATEEHDHYR